MSRNKEPEGPATVLGTDGIRTFIVRHFDNMFRVLEGAPQNTRLMTAYRHDIKHIRRCLERYPRSQLLFFPTIAWNDIQEKMKFTDCSNRILLSPIQEEAGKGSKVRQEKKCFGGVTQPRLLMKGYTDESAQDPAIGQKFTEIVFLLVFEHESAICVLTQLDNLRIPTKMLKNAFKCRRRKGSDGDVVTVYGDVWPGNKARR